MYIRESLGVGIVLLFALGGCPTESSPTNGNTNATDDINQNTNGSADVTGGASVEPKWGINAHLPDDQTLDAIVDAGITWVRYAVDWSAIEPVEGSRFWDFVDERVAAGVQRDLHIVMTLTSTPDWAGTTGSGQTNDPPDSEAWAAFVADAVARYKDNIHYWGLWNEPNGGDQDYFAGTPEQYRELILIPGAAAARQTDPTCKIVAPGITIHTDWHLWMQPIFASGGAEAIDIVAVHLYTLTGDADDWLFNVDDRPTDQRGDIWPLESVLTELDLMEKPCWILEMGWCTGGKYAVSEDAQATYLQNALWGVRERDFIDRVFPYCIIDDSSGEDGQLFGLLREDYGPKSSYNAYLEFITHPTAPVD